MARIKVKFKATGQTGSVDEKEFDPNIYEFVGVVPQTQTQPPPPAEAAPPPVKTPQKTEPMSEKKPSPFKPPPPAQNFPPPPTETISLPVQNIAPTSPASQVLNPQPFANENLPLQPLNTSFADIQKKVGAEIDISNPPPPPPVQQNIQTPLPSTQPVLDQKISNQPIIPLQPAAPAEELAKSLQEKVNQQAPLPPPAALQPQKEPNPPVQPAETVLQPAQSPVLPTQPELVQTSPKDQNAISHSFVIPAPTPQVPKLEPIKVVQPIPVPSKENPHLKMPPLTKIPNVLNGIVQNKEGNLLEDTIVLVKDTNNIPVRALKTNKLGQFVISTPVPDGNYKIEAEKESFLFDIIEIEAKGDIIEPISIRAR